MSSEDLDSDVDFSTDQGSTPTTPRDGDITEGTANYDEDTLHEGGMGGDMMEDESLYDDIAIAVAPTESDGVSEYHEIALTGSAALDVLDQVIKVLPESIKLGFVQIFGRTLCHTESFSGSFVAIFSPPLNYTVHLCSWGAFTNMPYR